MTSQPMTPLLTEGEWIPLLAGYTVPGTNTYNVTNTKGVWCLIGTWMHFNGWLELTAFDAATRGILLVKGLPTQYDFDLEHQTGAACAISTCANFTPRAGYTNVVGNGWSYAGYSGCVIGLQVYGPNKPLTATDPTQDTVGNTFTLSISGAYRIYT